MIGPHLIGALCAQFEIRDDIRQAAIAAAESVQDFQYPAQDRVKANVLAAFAHERIAESDLAGATGYGYEDAARERYESLLCRILGAQRTLARLSIVSGTHAIVTALAACVPPGKTLLSVTGKPYDTLRNAIVSAPYSLCASGVRYVEVDAIASRCLDGGSIPHHDTLGDTLHNALRDTAHGTLHDTGEVAAIFIQRSRGYAPRRSLSIRECETLIEQCKGIYPDAAVLVDNCYGELVEDREPTHVGADLIMGSLIKNLGGTFAPAGGYVAGRADLVEQVAARLYAPGLRDALGPTLGFGRAFIQGLFAAPLIVEQSLHGLDFAAALFSQLGFAVDPLPGATRTDIVQAIRLGSAERLIRFAQSLQKAMPVNSQFAPEPGPVPGYVDPVIMSSGAFVGGATIELSCDAPLREPYEVYLQGGLMDAHGVLGAMLAAQGL